MQKYDTGHLSREWGELSGIRESCFMIFAVKRHAILYIRQFTVCLIVCNKFVCLFLSKYSYV